MDANIRQYASQYVWDVANDDSKRDLVIKCLEAGEPFQQEEFMVVCLVDISGYSTITANLTRLGKRSSEIITTTVNEFFSKIINVVHMYSGDVVKFLGDAVLVSFTAVLEDDTETSVVERAIACCVQIQLNHARIDIDIGNREVKASTTTDYNTYTTMKPASLTGNLATSGNCVHLGVHVSIASSIGKRQIMGLPSVRMDYSLTGDCLRELGPILDETKLGEVGISRSVLSKVGSNVTKTITLMGYNVKHPFLCLHLKDLIEIDKVIKPKIKRGPTTLSPELPGATVSEGDEIPPPDRSGNSHLATEFIKKFMNKSLLQKVLEPRAASVTRENTVLSSYSTHTTNNSHDFNKLRTNDSDSIVSPTHQSLSPTTKWTTSAGEFRRVTVIFAKVPLDISKTNTILVEFIKSLEKFEGVFQQYAEDDKGRCLLGCFGLPPWTHEKDAKHALQVAQNFYKRLDVLQLPRIPIGIASGDLLISTLGNNVRMDASLLGYCVNFSARLLNISQQGSHILCDDETYQAGRQDVRLASFGQHKSWISIVYENVKKVSDYPHRQHSSAAKMAFEVRRIEDTEDSLKLDSQSRIALLKKALVAIFCFVSDKTRISFIFDDCQWADSVSLEVLYNVVKECPKACILFFTRPIANIELDYMSRISRIEGGLHVVLEGFGISETAELLLEEFRRDYEVTSIESSLLNAIFEITKGHPLQIDLLCGALKSKMEEYLLISPNGTLSAKNDQIMDGVFKSIGKAGAAMVQFDRLSPIFKKFLLYASVLGQYFHVGTIYEAFGFEELDPSAAKDWIAKEDTFHFLVPQENAPAGSFYFRHIQVMNCIYESQSYESREKLHFQAAVHFEQLLHGDFASTDTILPLITYHFSKTNEVGKNVHYMEQLSFLQFRKCYYRECQNCLETLCAYIQDESIRRALQKKDEIVLLDPIRHADFLAHLVFVLVQQKKLDNVPALAQKALSLTGLEFPTTEKDISKALVKSMIGLLWLWRKTNGGRLPYKTKHGTAAYLPHGVPSHYKLDGCKDPCEECPKVRRVHSMAFTALFQAGVVSYGLSLKALAYTMFQNCSIAIKTAPYDNGEFVVACHRAAFGTFISLPKVSRIFLRVAMETEEKRKLGAKAHAPYTSTSYMAFATGDIPRAYHYAALAHRYFTERGDKANAMAAQGFMAQYPFWDGQIDLSISLSEGQYTPSSYKISPTWCIFSACQAARHFIFKGDLARSVETYAVIKQYTENPSGLTYFRGYPALRTFILGWLCFIQDDLNDALKAFIEMAGYFKGSESFAGLPAECLTLGSILVCVLVLTLPSPTPGSTEHTQRLEKLTPAISELHKQTDKYSRNTKYPIMFWAARLYELAQGTAESKRKAKREVNKLIKLVKGKRKSDLEKVRMMKAGVYAIIGRAVENPSEAAEYSSVAVQLFESFGASPMATWAKSSLNSRV
ncbi:hypothetical protein HDV05_001946 [Chytridiales sp. JEL 0842]|nr:hypothetical protein HDV05_001946 [Chytridiales sp. JEL 0842]